MQSAARYCHATLHRAPGAVDDALAALIEDELDEVSARRARRLFDPACGPGRWLARWATAGWRVGGNDSSSESLRLAAASLRGACLELTRRDLGALAFTHAPYDAAVAPSGDLAELDDAAFVDHLTSARRQLRAGGGYLCVLPVDDDPAQRVREVEHHEVPLPDGGWAFEEHRLLERAPGKVWRVRRTIRVRADDGGERTTIDERVLHVRPLEAVLELAKRAGLEPASIRCADTGALLAPGRSFTGAALFVLRVPASAVALGERR